jgi:DNA-binding GntR family transcriptional regulator
MRTASGTMSASTGSNWTWERRRTVDDARVVETKAERMTRLLEERLNGMEPSERLPTKRELTIEFGVSGDTVERVLTSLRTRGVVRSVHGRGTFLIVRPADAANEDAPERPLRAVLAAEGATPGVLALLARIEALEAALASAGITVPPAGTIAPVD